MPIHVFLAAAAVSASLPLLWLSVATTRRKARTIPGSVDIHELALERSASDRIFRPMLEAVSNRVRGFAPAGWAEGLERRIVLAGAANSWPIERTVATKLALALVGLLGGWMGMSNGAPGTRLVATAFVGVLGFFGPDLLLNSRARERQDAIQRALPDVLDQITMSVEAGLGFEGALARAAHAGEGPLAEELIYALQEMQIGTPRHVALKNLAARTEVPDLRNFVFAVVQAEAYGLPIAQVLRVQASELRLRRRQRAEEAAMKVPVKIIFPLLFCIFPSLFIVLLGPAAIRIWRSLAG